MAELELGEAAGREPGTSLSQRPADAGPPEAPPEAGVMTLVEHLEELRRRLFISVAVLAVTSVVGFIIAPTVIDALVAPIKDQVQIITVGGGFFVQLKLAVIIGVALALPVIVLQLWRFVSPGLTARERQAIRPWLPLSGLFFALGVIVAYVVFPFAWAFLTGFNFNLKVDVSFEYFFDFVLILFLAFGVVMEFPIVLVLLNKLGILPLSLLKRQRRYALLLIVIFAVIITPGGDPYSPTVMSAVMYVLYEVTIFMLSRGPGASRDRKIGRAHLQSPKDLVCRLLLEKKKKK